MRITSKGQVTIPKEIRERLGIEPGSVVEFEPTQDGRVVLVNKGATVLWFGLAGTALAVGGGTRRNWRTAGDQL